MTAEEIIEMTEAMKEFEANVPVYNDEPDTADFLRIQRQVLTGRESEQLQNLPPELRALIEANVADALRKIDDQLDDAWLRSVTGIDSDVETDDETPVDFTLDDDNEDEDIHNIDDESEIRLVSSKPSEDLNVAAAPAPNDPDPSGSCVSVLNDEDISFLCKELSLFSYEQLKAFFFFVLNSGNSYEIEAMLTILRCLPESQLQTFVNTFATELVTNYNTCDQNLAFVINALNELDKIEFDSSTPKLCVSFHNDFIVGDLIFKVLSYVKLICTSVTRFFI
jgi:hypothetical protein